VPGHKVAPPRHHRSCRADAPDRSCRAAAPSSLRRAPAQTRRADQGAGARGQVRLRQRLLLECSKARRASRWLSGRRSSERQRRAADKRLPGRFSGSLPNAIRRAPQTASASGIHNWSQRFVAVIMLVLVRQMRTSKVGLAARRHAVTARVAALQAHWHTTATRIAAHVRAVPFELLSSLSTTIEDVSPSQI
jgi:hypothetical protein